MIKEVIGFACFGWALFISAVLFIGLYHLQQANRASQSSYEPVGNEDQHISLPHVTVIRPVKDLEPLLYECLASTFKQTYPKEKLTVYFCVSSHEDLAIPTIERLLAHYSDYDAKLLVEEEDARLAEDGGTHLGPNPKIRNMSRAYREAKSDIVWIVDCNVWIGPNVAGKMVDLLCGFDGNRSGRKKYKFVHQLPLSIDISRSDGTSTVKETVVSSGGLLEEMFLSTSHAKFYTAINAVAVAPCIVGKSNMFRRSHLDALTSKPSSMNSNPNAPKGIDYFSFNICEDHLIGDLLWKSPVPTSVLDLAQSEGFDPRHPAERKDYRWGNHAMLPPTSPENLAIQPMDKYSLRTYVDRRVRWLRVRKFTVTLATLVEPGTESFLCCAFAAHGLATVLGIFFKEIGFASSWTTFWIIWVVGLLIWAYWDRWCWKMLHLNHPDEGPSFMKSRASSRPLRPWLLGWLGREALAFPIWAWAFFGGVTVVWRGRKFWVGLDMRVHEIGSQKDESHHERHGEMVSEVANGDTGSGGESGRKRR